MKRLLVILLFLAPAPAWGQRIDLPARVVVPVPGMVIVRPTAVDADDVAWFAVDDGLQLIPTDLLLRKDTAVGVALAKGTYRVRAVAAKVVDGKARLSPVAECLIEVATGPTPPGPGPNPPDPPGPSPGPAPIPLEGLRVLVIYETGELDRLPATKSAILFARTVRDYLNAKCVVGPDGKTREWRMWDKDVDCSREASHWQEAMKRRRGDVPWLIISTGRAGYEGPLPSTVDEVMSLLKKYGG